MNKKYDVCVFLGRMQPPTKAHIMAIEKALSIATCAVVVLGSAGQARTVRNPFTVSERIEMLCNVVGTTKSDAITFVGVKDNLYNDTAWAADVQSAVNAQPGEKVAIIGHKKDESSYYLDLFPQWDFIEADVIEDLNATDIRKEYFETGSTRSVQYGSVGKFMQKFKLTDEYARLAKEWDYIEKYKKSWESAPYPVNLVCCDAVVIKSGHVLVVTRKAAPGEGLLALPGGYVNVNETVQDAMIRELREETRLKVPTKVLIGSIKGKELFDNPVRSLRGRVMTMAYLVDLGSGELDKVKGGDDALNAKWMPIGEFLDNPELVFEDHSEIFRKMVGV